MIEHASSILNSFILQNNLVEPYLHPNAQILNKLKLFTENANDDLFYQTHLSRHHSSVRCHDLYKDERARSDEFRSL